MKYAWVAQHRDSHPVSILCEVLGVSKSGYYAWLDRSPSSRVYWFSVKWNIECGALAN